MTSAPSPARARATHVLAHPFYRRFWAAGLISLLLAILLVLQVGADRGEARFTLRKLASDPVGGGDATISPDGRSFVMTSKRDGNWNLWVFTREDGKWSQLTHGAAESFEGKWSPDGKLMVFTSSRAGSKDVWVMSLAGDHTLRLTSDPGEEEYPAWSPDGRTIVYTGGPWGARDVYLAPAAGGPSRKLTRKPSRLGACTFDPDGRSLVCHTYEPGTGALERIWLPDGEVTPLTASSEDWDYKPTSSPDGKWIAFSRSRHESPAGIWVLPASGGRPLQLSRSPYEDRWPTWSGDSLFFHRLVEDGVALRLVERSTGRVTTLLGPEDHPLQGSLDGESRRLVYCAQTAAGKRLRLFDRSTGARTTLAAGPNEACFPRWSPDGRWIAFATKPPDGRWEIAVMRPDGSGLTRLTAGIEELRGLSGPIDWSPDGKLLLFHSATQPFEANLYTLEVATRRLRRLTTGPWFDEAPAFAPDGKSIVYMSTRKGDWTWSLCRQSLADGHVQVFAGPDWEEKNFPRIGPDGSTVWSARDERDRELLIERSAGGQTRRLVGPAEAARWPSYVDGGHAILYTSVTHHVEYWLAENLFAKDSPLVRPATSGASQAQACERARPQLAAKAIGGPPRSARSPVDMFHR